MRTFIVFLLGIGVSVHTISLAQQRPDKILTIDNAQIDARVLEIAETVIRYKDFNDAQGTVKTMAKTQVAKIIYSNGYVEEYTATNTPAATQNEVSQEQNLQLYNTVNDNQRSNQDQNSTTLSQQGADEGVFAVNTGNKTIPERKTTGLIVGVGLDAAYMIGESAWVNVDADSLGFRQGFGASAWLQYTLPNRKFGFMGTVGYKQWSVRRIYGPEEEKTNYLKNLSLTGGIKAYLGGGFYMTVEGGLFNMQLSSEAVIDGEVEADTETTSEIGIAGGIGYEFLAGPLMLDISGKYHLIGIGLNPEYEDLGNIGFIGVRLGIGYIVL